GSLLRGRPPRLRKREPRPPRRHPCRARRGHLRHPARERARAEPQPRHRGGDRPLRGAAPAGGGVVRRRALVLAAALLAAACSACADTTTTYAVPDTAVPRRHAVPENGYVVESDRVQVYVAGDTRYFPELVDVATRFPHLDVALLPVGGERYFGFGREMGPADAARAAALLGPARVIPIGYGKRGGFPLLWFARHPSERF